MFFKLVRIGAVFYTILTDYCGFMRLKNNIFAAAFDELKRNHGVKTQKQLARMMGVSEDTITRILKDRTDVTEDIITKLQTASGCIFNLQWLRGEDAAPMLANNEHQAEPQQQEPHMDHSSLVNALVAAKDETIESLKRELASKDDLVAAMQSELTAKNDHIATLKERLQEYRHIIESHTTGYPYPIGAAEPNKPTAK